MLNRIKTLLSIEDDLQDELLETIKEQAEAHFKIYTDLQYEYIPFEYEFIIIDVVVKRFNRLGAEGMSSKSVEGASVNFEMLDFKEYDHLLEKLVKRSGVQFL